MSQQNNTIRRLAVLVDSLDSSSAGQFLNSVPVRTADEIRGQVVDLGKVSKSEREQVLQQFLFAVHGVQDSVLSSATTQRVRSVPPSVLHGSRVEVSRQD